MRDDEPRLRALEGGGVRRTPPRSLLSPVRDSPSAPSAVGAQLSLPTLDPALPGLILASLAGLAEVGLVWALQNHHIRTVVDLRLAPSFRRLNLRYESFCAVLAESGVGYEHLFELADPNPGDAWHLVRYRNLLTEHYRGRRAQLERLQTMSCDGPLLLIFPGRSEESQRALSRALGEVAPDLRTHTL